MYKTKLSDPVQNRIRAGFILVIVMILLGTFLRFFANRGTYDLHLPENGRAIQAYEVMLPEGSSVEYLGGRMEDGELILRFRARTVGTTTLQLHLNRAGEEITDDVTLSVNIAGTLIRQWGGDFNNWQVLFLGFAAAMVLCSVFLFQEFRYRIRTRIFSYPTLLSGGLAIFVLGLSIPCAALGILILTNYWKYTADIVWVYFRYSYWFFVLISLPFIVIFSLALSVSNLRLIRKEGFRPVNLLGIAISIAVLIGVYLCQGLPSLLAQRLTEYHDSILRIQYVTSSVFCFFLSFLLSTMICALVAAKHVPAFDKDYIIILGCGIREDGTLYPLLQGRADRALWYWNRQYEETGKRAVFVPSGGRGPDEIISEGEAVRKYLLAHDVPAEYILPETRSRTTLENMKFSGELIRTRDPSASIMFSTTNYHVFRSGMLAREAGIRASGIGSRTRWYFWPNAFVREFAGLLYSARRFGMSLLLGLALCSALFSILL